MLKFVHDQPEVALMAVQFLRKFIETMKPQVCALVVYFVFVRCAFCRYRRLWIAVKSQKENSKQRSPLTAKTHVLLKTSQ